MLVPCPWQGSIGSFRQVAFSRLQLASFISVSVRLHHGHGFGAGKGNSVIVRGAGVNMDSSNLKRE